MCMGGVGGCVGVCVKSTCKSRWVRCDCYLWLTEEHVKVGREGE